jgi:signal transduction histidine kinase
MTMNSLIQLLPNWVARVPANVHAKLLGGFLVIVVLLITVGIVGLQVLSGVNRRTEETVDLQRKIAAYRRVQHGTTSQLYNVNSALLVPDEQTLETTLRQLNQFGYDLDRLHFVAKDEVELLGHVQATYDQFLQIVTQVVELIRASKVDDARRLQLAEATPLADRLERLTNQLVNRAAADVVASIETSHSAYLTARWLIIAFALASIGLALILGFSISWSLIGPVKKIDAHLKNIAAGNFSKHVDVPNQDELGNLTANLNRMNDELGQLYQQLHNSNLHKSQFLANVNHELRTPVSAIIGYANLLMRETRGQLAPQQTENLQDLLNNAKRQLALIDSLLDFAKIEAGKVEIQLEPVKIDELVRGAVATVEPIVNKDTVRLIDAVPATIAPIQTDCEKLRQIVLNLLGNAIKFTDCGQIKISAYQQNGHLKLAVADTGIGIEAGDLSRIFEEFDRGRLSNNGRYRGTGLGLAIVKRLVDLLGGSIVVESEVGKGSTFTVTLPVKPHEAPSA